MQPHGGAEEHHDGAFAGLEQLELTAPITARGENPLAQVEQLPHRLRLELPPQIAGRNADTVER
jgi:hypothetical protein